MKIKTMLLSLLLLLALASTASAWDYDVSGTVTITQGYENFYLFRVGYKDELTDNMVWFTGSSPSGWEYLVNGEGSFIDVYEDNYGSPNLKVFAHIYNGSQTVVRDLTKQLDPLNMNYFDFIFAEHTAPVL